jgi:hypothetical protein
MSQPAKQRVQRLFHRNQIAAVEETYLGPKLHGRRRTWHRNGQLATKEFYRNGLLHGKVCQWDKNGKLLGSFQMEHGTGTQKSWHDNGQLNLEFSTVDGHFCGRSRFLLRDGTLISDRLLLFGRPVSVEKYRQAMRKEPRLPKLHGRLAKSLPKNRATQKHIQHVFVRGLLAKDHRDEARTWLKPGAASGRSLGRFKGKSAALKFVESLYQAGAAQVIVPDIYEGKGGDEFADYLLVRLPKTKSARAAIRKVAAEVKEQRLGAIEPDKDIGEEYLILSLA